MSIFSDNIRVLRARKNISQQKLADDLNITRSRYVKYEDGTSEPPIDLLIRMSQYFHLSIDVLVSVDVRKYAPEKMMKVADNRILLPVAVNADGDNKIEIIPEKTSMGYLSGYASPEYIESLQTLSLPFLRNGKYRAFPAKGDSMPPYKDGTYIVGRFVEHLSDLKAGKTYVFITTDGIVYKRFQFHEGEAVCVQSDNRFYEPYQIPLSDIYEIWEFACSISTTEYEAEEFAEQNIREMFMELKRELREMKGGEKG